MGSDTLLYSEFPPHERGMAMGMLGVPILFAPALGPTLGGYLITYASWQLIFYINVPIGIVGVIMAAVFLRELPHEGNPRFDGWEFLLSGIELGSVLYAFYLLIFRRAFRNSDKQSISERKLFPLSLKLLPRCPGKILFH